MIFRWYLRKVYASVYFIFLSLAGTAISQIQKSEIQFGAITIALAASILVVAYLKRKGTVYTIKTWKKSYSFIFYYSAIIFGIIHLSNHKELTIADPNFVFYIASQTFGGLGLGYLRIKYGLVYSILFHALFNLVVLAMAILFS